MDKENKTANVTKEESLNQINIKMEFKVLNCSVGKVLLNVFFCSCWPEGFVY